MQIEKLLKYFLLSAFFLLLLLLEARYTLSKDYGRIAEVNLLKGHYDTAFQASKHALILNIHNEQAYVVMAKLNLMLFEQTHENNAFHTAFVAIKNAINNDPYESFYYDIAGLLYLSNNDYTNAIRMYQIAAAIYPQYLYFQNQLALAYHFAGKNNKALAILNNQTQLYQDYIYASHPDSIDIIHAYFLKACIYYRTGKYDNALNTLDKILSLSQSGFSLDSPVRRDKRIITIPQIHAFAMFDKGFLYKRIGDYRKAQTFLTTSYNAIPALKTNHNFLMVFSMCK